jgi:DNA-binding response OmpR family regulator
MAPLILVADDESNIRSMVCDYMEKLGYRTQTATDGRDVLRVLKSSRPDLLLLDVMMPELDGFSVAKLLLNQSEVPILFMTARAEEADRVLGLELGADDYIVKPFSLREMAARIQAVLRRIQRTALPTRTETTMKHPAPFLSWKDLEVDLDTVRVRQAGRLLDLTTVQFQILVLFLQSPGRVFSRLQVLQEARETSMEGYERTIDVHVKNLRKILGDDAKEPRYIETVRGLGYRLAE